MKKLALAACLVSMVALAEDKKMEPSPDSMGWTHRKVTKEDKKGIQAMLDAFNTAFEAGDLATAMSYVDFPIYMVTDSSKGVVTASAWDKAQYQQVMEPMAKKMAENKDAGKNMGKPKLNIEFLSDSLVVVTSRHSMKMGKQTIESRGATLVINKDGKWMLKSEISPGWGDAPGGDMQGGAQGGQK